MNAIKSAASEIVIDCFRAGYSYAEIAKHFGVSAMVIARIIYGMDFSTDKSLKIIDKAGLQIKIARKE